MENAANDKRLKIIKSQIDSYTNEIKECVIVTDKESFDIYDYMIERYNDSNIEINIRRYDTVHMVREGAE